MPFPSGVWSIESSSTHNVRMKRLEMFRFLWTTKCDFFVLLGRFNETWWQIFWKRSHSVFELSLLLVFIANTVPNFLCYIWKTFVFPIPKRYILNLFWRNHVLLAHCSAEAKHHARSARSASSRLFLFSIA